MSERNLAVRKQLGQFYTPHREAASFAAWAIRSGSDRILEPSVGDGALLLPALALARELGGVEGPSAIACDIDPTTVDLLRPRFGPEVELVESDFFTLDPANAKLVDVVLANPPFTRNHQMSLEMRASLRARYPLKGAAGLWAYFVLHARKFLRPGGRMAFVVPAAAIFTDYSASLLAQLSEEFRDIALYELPAKPAWIGAADERGALLIADGYQAGRAKEVRRGLWSYENLSTVAGLEPAVSMRSLKSRTCLLVISPTGTPPVISLKSRAVRRHIRTDFSVGFLSAAHLSISSVIVSEEGDDLGC